jgi:hypothetical protein
MTSVETPYLAALQAAVAGEHAAVWACGRAAAELSGSARTAALRDLDAHRIARDDLRRAVVALGAEPVPAAAAYVEPFDVAGRRGGRRLLAHVGTGLAATYADLAAVSPPASRRQASAAASAAAVRALRWGAQPEAFPGG